MTNSYTPVIGTNTNDTLSGSANRDFISGRAGDDSLKGLGGDDILMGGGGADMFVYSAVPSSGISESDGFHEGVDAILDFSRTEGDKIDLSALGALTFTGTTRTAHSVYYQSGVDARDNPLAGHPRYGELQGGVTLLADLDGDENANPDFMIAIWGVNNITASDLILAEIR